MRLNRFLAQCGVASRRNAEKLIEAGRVFVNNVETRKPATPVDPSVDQVQVDGKVIRLPVDFLYILLNKPAGYDVTRHDRFAKRLVYELLPRDTPDSVQAVGRLDRDTTGLLLLTNDGDLAFRLTHPRFEVEKEYLAFGHRNPTMDQIRRLLQGMELEDGPARADSVDTIGSEAAAALGLERMEHDGLRISLHQGRKRIVRRLCEAAGYPLVALHRIRVGNLTLGRLPSGECRRLKPDEARRLRRHVGLAPEPEPRGE